MGTPKAIIIADRHPISSKKPWRGLTLALLMAAIAATFGACCEATNRSSTFGVAAQSLARAETAHASLERNSTVKTKAVVAAPLVATSDSVAAPDTAEEAWMEKLRQDIHEARLRLCKWNEEIKRKDRKFAAEEQEVTGSITTVPMVAGARGPCE